MAVAPPPLSPPPRSGQSTSSSSSAAALTALPVVLTTLLDEFLGVHGRRPLAHAVSRALRETTNTKCSETECLASPVPRACVDGCVLRGERLVAEAYALDPGVTDLVRFRRIAATKSLSVAFEFIDDAVIAQQRHQRRQQHLGEVGGNGTSAEQEAPERKKAKRAVDGGADGRMRIRFGLDGVPRTPTAADARLTADALEWEALYAPEAEPNAIVREIEAEIAREERRQRADEAARDRAKQQGESSSPPPPATPRPIDAIKRLRSLYRPLSAFGRLMRDIARLYQQQPRKKFVTDTARERARIKAAWHAATGRAFEHELPDAAEWPRVHHVPWVAYVLHAVFRNADEARTWRVRVAHDTRVEISGRVSVTRIGVVTRRLLSEPPAVFNELAIVQPRVTRVSLRDPTATTRAALLVLRGIRVWRGSDIVASRFRVVDVTVAGDAYAPDAARVAAVQAEFARLFPPRSAPLVLYGAPAAATEDEKKRVDVTVPPGEDENE